MKSLTKHVEGTSIISDIDESDIREVENSVHLSSRRFVTQDFIILFGKLSINGVLAKVLSVSANGVKPTSDQMFRFANKFRMTKPWDLHLHGPTASHIFKFILH